MRGNLPNDSSGATERQGTKTLRTLQECAFDQAVLAVKASSSFRDWQEFRSHLIENLPYNSALSRAKFAQLIHAALYPDGDIRTIGEAVWRAYEDDSLLRDVVRVSYLDNVVAMGEFVVQALPTLPAGSDLPMERIQIFLRSQGVTDLHRAAKRLAKCLVKLGLCRRQGRALTVMNEGLPSTACLILVHDRLAREPATLELAEILDDPFWRYLGGRDAAEVRSVLRRAAAEGLIDRYTAIDRLEQITTRFPLDEFLEKRLRL